MLVTPGSNFWPFFADATNTLPSRKEKKSFAHKKNYKMEMLFFSIKIKIPNTLLLIQKCLNIHPYFVSVLFQGINGEWQYSKLEPPLIKGGHRTSEKLSHLGGVQHFLLERMDKPEKKRGGIDIEMGVATFFYYFKVQSHLLCVWEKQSFLYYFFYTKTLYHLYISDPFW